MIVTVAALACPLPAAAAVNTAPPASPVKLVFIHHSVGEAWLADGHGGLGIALRDNNYFVSDTNYGWGPGAIGDRTDIGHWWTWFRSASAGTYLSALYDESDRHSNGYSRLAADPGGRNTIVMFKSCYPNSVLGGQPDAPVPSIDDNPMKGAAWSWQDATYTIARSKGIYLDLLPYFAAHPEKLFVVVVAPPRTDPLTPGGRALANWLVDHWLQDSGYTANNVMVFDLYTVLTSKTGNGDSDVGLPTGNHHRVWEGAIQHKTDEGADRLAYPSADGNSHPNAAGSRKATAEFLPLLNAAYNAWKGNDGGDISIDDVAVSEGNSGTTSAVFTVSLSAASGLPVTAAWTTADGSALAGSDYTAAAGNLTFAPGETTRTITVAVLGDAVVEPDESFSVALSGASGAAVTDGSGLGTIVNDDATTPVGPKTFATRSASVRKGNKATLYYRVTDDSSRSATVTIRIRTRGGALKKTLALGLKDTGPEHHVHFTCRLARGVYQYSVDALDLDGNTAQRPLGSNRLTVR
jgi:hypothetical protein